MDIYQNNIQKYRVTGEGLGKNLNNLALIRLAVFMFLSVIILVLANERLGKLIWIIFPICVLGFGLLVRRYNQVAYQKQHATFLKEINEQEVLRQENKLSGFPTGQTFIDRDHPYVSDLDIFGPHSLFQLINRTTTESGNACLAGWLSKPAPKDIILGRQKAVQELTPNLEWRQDLQASGMHFTNVKSDFNKLLAWIEKPVQLLPNRSKYLIGCILLSTLSTSATVYFIIHLFHFLLEIHPFSLYYITPLIIILLINSQILKRIAPVAEEIINNTHQNVKMLGGYQSLIVKIESRKFDSEILQRLQAAFSQDNYSAASEINKLKKILEAFQHRGTKKEIGRNTVYSIFNILWLFDVYWILLTEKWKQRNSPCLKSWAAAVGEIEALSSLAGFSYANPSFTFPEISDEPYHIHFEKLGHPLLSSEKRICNNFNLESRGEIAMVTGSNMAGKSTFLRTVGANLVLALMGAPCCAKSGKVSNIQLFSSMRTQDNLEEGVSSFYAELKRIEQLLKLIESGQSVFFLLDEMFKGTNSKDRHKGGFSLIKQLEGLNAFGIISTHDLDLAILAGKYDLVANYSFNSGIREGEMTFDYELTNGLCRDFNASELMKKRGIQILSHFDER